MSTYTHPLKDTLFVLKELVDFDSLSTDLGLDDVNLELAEAILSEAGKLGAEVLAPLNQQGDQQGATLTAEGVKQSAGFAAAYQQYVESGWPALVADEAFGGARSTGGTGDRSQRNLAQCQHGLRAVPDALSGRGGGADRARQR